MLNIVHIYSALSCQILGAVSCEYVQHLDWKWQILTNI